MTSTLQPDPLPQQNRLRWRSIAAVYRARLRHEWLQELLAVTGIAIGVALLFAASVASTSLSGPVEALNRGLVGNSQLQLVARGSGGVPQRISDVVRDMPGVRIAAPVLQVEAHLVGPRGSHPVTVFGADPRAVRLRGSLLQGFTPNEAAEQEALGVPAPIARPLGIRFGDDAQLQIDGRTAVAPIAIVGRDDIGAIADTSIALGPLAYVQKLARLPGVVSRILVEADPDQLDAVRDRLRRLEPSGLDVRPSDYEARLFDVASAPASQSTMIASVLSAIVGFLFAFCAMLVSAGSRRALAIDLRLDGFTPWQVARILLFDALVIGAAAVLVGLTLGELVSRRGYGSDVQFLSGAFPLGDMRIVTWSSYAIAIAGGLLAAALGVLAPVRHVVTARVPQSSPSAGVASDRAQRTAQVVGVALLVVALVVTATLPDAALLGLIALGIALVLLMPSFLAAVTAALAKLSERRSRAIMSIELALPQLRARQWRARSLAIATIGAVAVFGSVSLEGARDNLQTGLDGVSHDLNRAADLWVSPFGPGDLLATTAFTPTAGRTLSAVPGVRRVASYRSSFFDIAGRRVWVLSPPERDRPPVPRSQILGGTAEEAANRLRGGGWATVSQALADAMHLRIGDSFRLPALVPVRLRVAAITTNLGWSGGAIVLGPETYASAWRSPAISAYHVQLDPGTDPLSGRRRVEAALGAHPALRVETAAERSLRQQASARGGLSRLSQISTLTLLAAVLAMAAAMAALLWQRRSMVSNEKLDGHSTGVMWRALAVESGGLFVTGCLAGGVFALLGQALLSRALASISGFPVVYAVQGTVAVVSCALVLGVAMLVVAIPGYFVARVRPSLGE